MTELETIQPQRLKLALRKAIVDRGMEYTTSLRRQYPGPTDQQFALALMGEILTVDELATLLKMTRRQIYAMTETRTRAKQKYPLPLLRVNGNLRFSRSAVEVWLAKLQEESAA